MEQLDRKLFSWASILEVKTLEQAMLTAKMPFIFPHVALMPDAHLGMGATVGSVIPTRGAIIPAAVGVDIGCGMAAVRTQWSLGDIGTVKFLQHLHKNISDAIPLSAGKYNHEDSEWLRSPEYMERVEQLEGTKGIDQAQALSPNWRMQLGSLGSGNHFIEVSVDEEDRIWLFLHSGSRGVGNKLAQKHIKIAKEQCEKRWISLPDPDLAYLVEGEKEFWSYMEALRWAQSFAYLNRVEMMGRVVEVVEGMMEEGLVASIAVNCHHNYTQQERHFGENVWVSRKGAISANIDELGLIPGSMGTRSYVVKGLADRMALNSSPHGAGREYSRSRARKTFTRDDLDSRMEGIVWGESDAFLDEHPSAYKDIDVVMEDAKSMVTPIHTLRQIVNVKGD